MDVGRERHRPVPTQVSGDRLVQVHDPLAIVQLLAHGYDAVDGGRRIVRSNVRPRQHATDARAASGPSRCLVPPLRSKRNSTSPPVARVTAQSRGNHPGIVHDQEVAGIEQVRQVAKLSGAQSTRLLDRPPSAGLPIDPQAEPGRSGIQATRSRTQPSDAGTVTARHVDSCHRFGWAGPIGRRSQSQDARRRGGWRSCPGEFAAGTPTGSGMARTRP